MRKWVAFLLWYETGYGYLQFLSENAYVSFHGSKPGIDFYNFNQK